MLKIIGSFSSKGTQLDVEPKRLLSLNDEFTKTKLED